MKLYLKSGQIVTINDAKKIVATWGDEKFDFIEEAHESLSRDILDYCHEMYKDPETLTFYYGDYSLFVTTTNQIAAIEED